MIFSFKKLSKTVIFRVVYIFLGSILVLTIITAYAAVPPTLPTVTSGAPLTSALWNDLTNGVNNLQISLSNLSISCARRTASVSGSQYEAVSVSCNAGEIMTGGGCFGSGIVSGTPGRGKIVYSYPSSSNTWACKHNMDNAYTLTAYVVCCKIQ